MHGVLKSIVQMLYPFNLSVRMSTSVIDSSSNGCELLVLTHRDLSTRLKHEVHFYCCPEYLVVTKSLDRQKDL